MKITDQNLYTEANRLLKQLYGANASFREGQYEAIEAAITKHRSLVVQRTGWGKSLVYFLSTKLLRNRGGGVTLVVSPLLALVQNQMEAADRLSLKCDQLIGSTAERHDEILESMKRNELDVVFVTPETLFNEKVQPALAEISIGLFVIDEAHCISDWGHDFRLEYGRLKEVIHVFPANVPVLATTATANDRVIDDLKIQLGGDVYISRGPLARESLYLQIVPLETRAERCAWILENLKRLPGNGIIYCLTQRDCDMLAAFLSKNGIAARPYHSDLDKVEDGALNRETMELFSSDKLKVIVSTIKLGMGYDKGNIAFVIHFQMPSGGIVAYYQQIGRAGRNIPQANVFLMSGREDEEIIQSFIEGAFPTQYEADSIVSYITNHGDTTMLMLESELNMRRSRIEKALDFLENDGYIYQFIYKDTNGKRLRAVYRATANPYVYQGEKYRQLKAKRREEMEQMKELIHIKTCLSEYILRCLNDEDAAPCGHCVNCTGREILPSRPSKESLEAVQRYFQEFTIPIKPKDRWANGMKDARNLATAKIAYVNQEGICLSKYGDPGCGQLVKRCKYGERRYSDELLQKSVQVLRNFVKKHDIQQVTCVPSLRSDMVEDFAKRLAGELGLPFAALLSKKPSPPQKNMENSVHQCCNAYDSFFAAEGAAIPKRVLLVDDMVDSKWTLTVCGLRLMEKGCQEVYPFALADSSRKGD